MKKIFYLLIILFAFGISSCVDDFEEINSDPNASNVQPEHLFSRTLMCVSSDFEQIWHTNLGMCGAAVQHVCGAWDASTGMHYDPANGAKVMFNELWDNYYINGINGLTATIDLTEDDEEYHNLHYAARVWKVYLFSRLTDMYGDIPYFEAARGVETGNFTPKFDLQSEIYTDFFNELDIAVKAFDNTKADVQGDLLYDGNVDNWIKFANSLRLRLGLRLSKVNSTEAETQVRAAILGGVFESNSDNCAIPYGNYPSASGEFRANGTGHLYAEKDLDQGRAGFRVTDTLVNYMRSTSDPRLYIYARLYDVSSTEYVDITDWFDESFHKGLPQGNFWWYDPMPEYEDWGHWYDAGELNGGPEDGYWHDYTSRYLMPSEYMAKPENPFYAITYGEVELLLAEAAINSWGAPSGANTHLVNGVRAYCELIPEALTGAPTISASDVDVLIAALPSATLEVINTQLWVAHYLDPLEAYSNWRRSGYPAITPFQTDTETWYPTAGEDEIPRRFYYPNYIEYYNPTNYQEAISRLESGTDSWLDRVWWDVN